MRHGLSNATSVPLSVEKLRSSSASSLLDGKLLSLASTGTVFVIVLGLVDFEGLELIREGTRGGRPFVPVGSSVLVVGGAVLMLSRLIRRPNGRVHFFPLLTISSGEASRSLLWVDLRRSLLGKKLLKLFLVFSFRFFCLPSFDSLGERSSVSFGASCC